MFDFEYCNRFNSMPKCTNQRRNGRSVAIADASAQPSNSQELARLLGELESEQSALEAVINQVNSQVGRFREAGFFNESLVLGDVILQRHWGIMGPQDSSELVQAAICSERGLMAVFWELEEYLDAQQRDGTAPEDDAQDRCRCLDECPPLIRWLVANKAEQLLERLCGSAKIMNSRSA